MKALRGDHGQSLVELALALPILAFLLMGGADFARVYSAQVGVLNAARTGAEAAATRAAGVAQTGAVADDDATVLAYASAELAKVPGVDASPCTATPGGPCTITLELRRADGATACASPPTTAIPCYATVRVRYTFTTLVAWPLVPNSIVLDRSATFRMYQ